MSSGTNTGTAKGTLNCGQKPFKFPPPDGFQPLNLANILPETVIARPDQYVGVTTFQAPNSEPVVFDVFNFQPDLLIGKSRTNTYNFEWVDSVTGGAWVKSSNSSGAATEYASNHPIRSFNYNGFTAGLNFSVLYGSGDSVVWGFKAGGNKNTFNVDDVGYASAAAAGLDGGTIDPTGASVGTNQGFSILKYTGTGANATVSHGLGKVPKFMIIKNLDDTSHWVVYHHSLGTGEHALWLNEPDADQTGFDYWNGEPTSSVFTLGAETHASGTNLNTKNYINYIWSDVPGLQKFGSYGGNDVDDGPFIELGFKPAIVIYKNSTNAGNEWIIVDSKRDPHNVVKHILNPNDNTADDTSTNLVDFLSNGFKLRSATSRANKAGGVIVYAAWAESPTVNLYGGQSNAR